MKTENELYEVRDTELRKQIALKGEAYYIAGVNIINCNSCGRVLLHKVHEEEMMCPYCGVDVSPNDCSDYIYEGMELNGEFDFNNPEPTIYTRDEIITITNNMRRYGGGFMKALSECIHRADHENLVKLQSVFADDFEKYLNF